MQIYISHAFGSQEDKYVFWQMSFFLGMRRRTCCKLITNSLLPGAHTGWNGEVLWEKAGIYLSEILSAWVLVTMENLVIWKWGNEYHHFTQSFSPCLEIERHIAPFCRDQTMLMNDSITVMAFMSNKHILKYLNTGKSRKTHWILESILDSVK